jgi:hypothetical protein
MLFLNMVCLTVAITFNSVAADRDGGVRGIEE